jgi:hypothetical protein
MRHIYPVGLTACSGDSWRDTVHNIPMMLLCHVCCAGHPYEGLSSLPFWKAIAACYQEDPCKAASVQAPRVLRVATQGTTFTIACASDEPISRRALLPLCAIALLHLSSFLTPRVHERHHVRRSVCRGCDVECLQDGVCWE